MKRTYHVALGMLVAATIFAGCGGGGATTGGGPTPVGATTSPTLAPGTSPTPTSSLAPGTSPTPTSSASAGSSPTPSSSASAGASPTAMSSASPTATASAAPTGSPTPKSSPSPLPSATPTTAATGAVYHPSNNGSTFVMNGSLVVRYDRSNQYPSPEPTSTYAYGVSQSIAVMNPVVFNGSANAADFKISEIDNQTAPAQQTFSDTLDDYFSYSNTIYNGNFLALGFASVDDTGYKVRVNAGANNQLADILPEMAGATWSNMAGRTISTDTGNGQTSTQTYANDGSYNESVTYQNYMPSPNPTGSQLTNTATLVANIDGSANYNTPRLGTARKYNYVYSLAAPSAPGPGGTITETTTIPPAAGSTAAPTVASTTIPNWMPATVPGSLASESDIDNGPTAVPSACLAPSGFTTNANQIVQTKKRIDPLAGENELTTTTTYDMANVGPVCVILHDVQINYYDFSGQNGVGYFSGSPQQITTIDEVLYLSTESLKSIGRRSDARAALASSVNVSLAQGRISMLRNIARSRMFGAFGRGQSYRTTSRSFRGVLK